MQDSQIFNTIQNGAANAQQITSPQSLLQGNSLGEMFNGIMGGIFNPVAGQQVNLQSPITPPSSYSPTPYQTPAPINQDQQWFRGQNGQLYQANNFTQGTDGGQNFNIDSNGQQIGVFGSNDYYGPSAYQPTYDYQDTPNISGGNLLTDQENMTQNRLFALEGGGQQNPSVLDALRYDPNPSREGGTSGTVQDQGPPPLVDIPEGQSEIPSLGIQGTANPWEMFDMSGDPQMNFITGLMDLFGSSNNNRVGGLS